MIICLGRTSRRASVQPTWDSRETSSLPSRRSSSLFGLAPGGGCPIASIAACAGGLLHHHFTLTPEGAVCFCGPIRQIAPPRTLSGIVLSGVRTFLTPRRGRNHLADLGFHDNTGEIFLEGWGMRPHQDRFSRKHPRKRSRNRLKVYIFPTGSKFGPISPPHQEK